jgi:hypothetical protein
VTMAIAMAIRKALAIGSGSWQGKNSSSGNSNKGQGGRMQEAGCSSSRRFSNYVLRFHESRFSNLESRIFTVPGSRSPIAVFCLLPGSSIQDRGSVFLLTSLEIQANYPPKRSRQKRLIFEQIDLDKFL